MSAIVDTPLIIHVVLATLLAVQLAVYPPLVSRFAAEGFIKKSYVLAQEACKMAISLALLAVTAYWRSPVQKARAAKKEPWTVWRSVQVALVPATIYSLQNTLCLVAYETIDGLTFNLLNQTKLIWTAVFVLVLLKRRQTAGQWCALAMLFVAAVLLSVAKSDEDGGAGREVSGRAHLFGCAAALGAAMLSGLASACCQWALQVGGRDSFLFSAELGFFSICALFLTLGVELATGWPAGGDAQQMLTMGSVWASLDARTMVPILVNACGGVVVGLLTKFSGSVVKSYALIAGILLSTMLQMYFGGGGLTWQSKAAAPLVVVAMYLNFAFKAKKKGGAKSSPRKKLDAAKKLDASVAAKGG